MFSNRLFGLPVRQAQTKPAPGSVPSALPELSPAGSPPILPAPVRKPEFKIERYDYHNGEPGATGGHAVAHYVPHDVIGPHLPAVPVESIPPASLADWDRPFTAQVNPGHTDPFGNPGSGSIFAQPPNGVNIGDGPAFAFKGNATPLPSLPLAHTPAQVRDYSDLQRYHQAGEDSRPRLTPEKTVNGMLVADFVEDTATLQAGRAWLLNHANPAALEEIRPFLNGLDAVKVPDPAAAKLYARDYSALIPRSTPECARESASLSAVLMANLRESPEVLRSNPYRLSRFVNDECLARLDRHRDPARPPFPPAGTIIASHERLRREAPGGAPELLLAASVHHAHAAVSMAPAAMLAEQESIYQGLSDVRMRPDKARAFTVSHDRLRAASTGYDGFVHPLEYELRGLPDQMARAAQPQLPFAQGGGLTQAATYGDRERAQLLLAQGVRNRGPAMVNAAWKADVPMLELLTRDGTMEPAQLQSAWRAVEAHGDFGTARFLLGKHALSPMMPPAGSSEPRSPWEISFVRVAEKGHTEVADMLLNANVGPMARTQGFLGASQHGRIGVLGLLLGGTTPARRDQAVFMAAAHGHADAARIIRDAGISQDARERTLALAERSGNREMAALFRPLPEV